MAIREEVLSLVARDPRFGQALDEMQRQVADMDIAPEELDEIIDLLELMLQQPDKYAEILDAAIKDGLLEKDMFPPQMDPTFVVSLLAALYGMQDRLSKKMARGGLAQAGRRLAAMGHHGDTMLAHISPAEAEMLRRHGGAGTINPATGLPQYFKLFKFLKKIAPIALAVLAPVAAPMIGAAISGGLGLGLSSAAATALGGAAFGAGTSALTGQNVLQGALMGGLGAGAGGMLGGALGIQNPVLQSIAGNALAGGALGALTGKGALQGAARGAIGGGIAGSAGQMLEGGMQAAGQTFGNALTSGYSPGEAATGAALAGVARGLAPSDVALEQARNAPEITDVNASMGISPRAGAEPSWQDWLGVPSGQPGVAQNVPASAPAAGSSIPWGKLALGAGAALAASSILQAPPQVKQEISKLSPKQQEFFNKPLQAWDWNQLQQDASRANMGMGEYMAKNWNKVMGGQYNAGAAAAMGGPLSAVARFAKGAGSGRDDTIDAKLSDGEYVIDAETVALLGDGSGDAGAKRLDEMRRKIRQQKGKALAKGKFSPNAKSPLAYLKGVA